jgi:hypothetical protein
MSKKTIKISFCKIKIKDLINKKEEVDLVSMK